MAGQTQTLKIKCPYCGWVHRITIQVKAGHVEVVAGPVEVIKDLSAKLKELFKDREQEEANLWIAMPPCPNVDPICNKVYEANLRTGETRR